MLPAERALRRCSRQRRARHGPWSGVSDSRRLWPTERLHFLSRVPNGAGRQLDVRVPRSGWRGVGGCGGRGCGKRRRVMVVTLGAFLWPSRLEAQARGAAERLSCIGLRRGAPCSERDRGFRPSFLIAEPVRMILASVSAAARSPSRARARRALQSAANSWISRAPVLPPVERLTSRRARRAVVSAGSSNTYVRSGSSVA